MRPRAARWCDPLGRYIDGRGLTTVLIELSGAGCPVSRSTIYSWIRGTAEPRPAAARALVQVSAGALELADLYGRSAPPEETCSST